MQSDRDRLRVFHVHLLVTFNVLLDELFSFLADTQFLMSQPRVACTLTVNWLGPNGASDGIVTVRVVAKGAPAARLLGHGLLGSQET